MSGIEPGANATEQAERLNKIQKILATITRLTPGELADPNFIATNLSPERVTSIKNYYQRIQNLINEKTETAVPDINEESLAGINLGLVKIAHVHPRGPKKEHGVDVQTLKQFSKFTV